MIYDIFPSPSKHIKNLEKQFVHLDAEMNPKALGVSLFSPPQDSQDGSPAEAADAEGAAASEPAPAKAAPKGSPAAAPTTAVARDYTRDMAQLGWWRWAQPLRFLTCFFDIDLGVFWSRFMFFFSIELFFSNSLSKVKVAKSVGAACNVWQS